MYPNQNDFVHNKSEQRKKIQAETVSSRAQRGRSKGSAG